MSRGADVNGVARGMSHGLQAIFTTNSGYFPPVFEAVMRGRMQSLQYLLDHGADPEVIATIGYQELTPAQWIKQQTFPGQDADKKKHYKDMLKLLNKKK